jgi:hypothetical protein
MPEYIEVLIDWDCPQCHESNTDIPDQFTHCAYCGRVVMVGDSETLVFDEGWNVELAPAPAGVTEARRRGG